MNDALVLKNNKVFFEKKDILNIKVDKKLVYSDDLIDFYIYTLKDINKKNIAKYEIILKDTNYLYSFYKSRMVNVKFTNHEKQNFNITVLYNDKDFRIVQRDNNIYIFTIKIPSRREN